MPLIAIDGPSGSGKSTLAKALSTRLGLELLDTGAMYRAVALAAINGHHDLDDERGLGELARAMHLEMGKTITLEGLDVSGAIRTEAVSAAASKVAAKPAVREELVRRQKEWIVQHGGGVVEGRDIASVVAPDADVKVYLTADLDERGRRRSAELVGTVSNNQPHGVNSPPKSTEQAVAHSMQERDQRDTTRKASPLLVAEGAIVIDSTHRSVHDIVEEVVSYL